MPDGASIAYRVRKTGAPRGVLVLVHGVGSNMTRWSEFSSQTTLADSWDLLRLDLRGHGLSQHRGRIGMAEWCEDLSAILAAEGYGRAVIAGHCLGAGIGMEFSVRYPDRTAGLVLIEPVFRPALIGRMAGLARLRPGFIGLAQVLRALNALGLHRRRLAPLDLEMLDRETRALMAKRDGADALARYVSPLFDLRTTATAVYLQSLIALTGQPVNLRAIRAPVLALLTRAGDFTDRATTLRLLNELADCRTITMEARHWIPTEQPVAMREAVEDWCRML